MTRFDKKQGIPACTRFTNTRKVVHGALRVQQRGKKRVVGHIGQVKKGNFELKGGFWRSEKAETGWRVPG